MRTSSGENWQPELNDWSEVFSGISHLHLSLYCVIPNLYRIVQSESQFSCNLSLRLGVFKFFITSIFSIQMHLNVHFNCVFHMSMVACLVGFARWPLWIWNFYVKIQNTVVSRPINVFIPCNKADRGDELIWPKGRYELF